MIEYNFRPGVRGGLEKWNRWKLLKWDKNEYFDDFEYKSCEMNFVRNLDVLENWDECAEWNKLMKPMKSMRFC